MGSYAPVKLRLLLCRQRCSVNSVLLSAALLCLLCRLLLP